MKNNHFTSPYTLNFYNNTSIDFNTISELNIFLENKPELQNDICTVLDFDNHIFAFDYLGIINRKKFQLNSKNFTFD